MSLQRLRDRLSVLQIALACAAVLSGGGMAWTSLALAVAGGIWAFARPLPPAASPRSQRLWTAVVAVALALTVARAVLQADLLDAGVDFLLLLVVQRLFQRQRAREHLQLLLLGMLLMIIAAVINVGLDYPVLLAAYVLVAVMTLMVNHLLAEGERLGPRVMLELVRTGARQQPTLWRAATGVAAMAGAGALVVFLVFPRWGAGVFLRGQLARDPQSGFSDHVALGTFGRIKTDATVVARVVPLSEGPHPRRLPWHLRGRVFGTYRDGQWRPAPREVATPLVPMGRLFVFARDGVPPITVVSTGRGRGSGMFLARPVEGFAASTQTAHAQVILEDLGVDVLFAASEPLGIAPQPRGAIEQRVRFFGAAGQELRVDKLPGPIQYEFISRIGQPTEHELRTIGDPAVGSALSMYLQRNEALSGDVTALAHEIAGDAPSRYDKVARVMQHLADFAYTLDLQSSPRVEDGADPIEGFLFDTRAGHCEYFATAMAVLLRELGTPTRVVNGFYGGEKNDYGAFYAVRQSDAHSWVEVYFEGLGWITFDPTPPAGRIAANGAGWIPQLTAVLDALRYRYLEYVIAYDVQKQLDLLRRVGAGDSHYPAYLRVRWDRVGLGGAAVVAGTWIMIAWRRRRRRGPLRPDTLIYTRLLAILARRGYPKAPHESASKFAARLYAEGVPLARSLAAFARRYESGRFGQDEVDLPALRALARAVATPPSRPKA